jgi:small conductance mechanosensitive channel
MGDIMEEQLQTIDQVTATVIDLGLKFGPKVALALLILTTGYVVGGWAGRSLDRALGRFHLEPPVRLLMERVARLFVLSLFAIMALQNLGVELLPLIAGLGVAGAGIALAMQGVLSNVVAGLTIIFSRPFRVGDYISIVREEGEVLDIRLFSTTLGHSDLSRVVIPNRKIVGEILHNYGKIRQVSLEVGVSYGSDAADAVRAVQDVLRANPRVLKDRSPDVRIVRLGDSCATVSVAPWVLATDYGAAVGEINQGILEAFRVRHIRIAAPQREVRMLGIAQQALAGGNAA